MDKRVERNIARRIVRAVARQLEDVGFRQTKPTFVIRPGDIVTAFFHYHKFTFGAYFRIHLGVRVMNDTSVALALNGPSHEHAGQYSERDEDIQHCIQEMVSYCRKEGLPWLERWSDPTALLEAQGSPLRSEDQQALSNALAGRFNVQAIALSESLLGLRSGKNTAT
ncbi:MAG: hypothetical protein WBC51_24385 [Vicinamibacterales bacterium]